MRKSLILTFDFPPKRGGVSNSLWNICQHLPKNKFVVLTGPSDIEVTTNFTVHRKKLTTNLKFIWPKWLPLLWPVKRLIIKEKIQLLQAAQILPFGTVALIFKKLCGLPYLVYVYGQDLVISRDSKRKMWLICSILKNAEAVIANSRYTRNMAVELGARKEKVIIVYPPPNEFDHITVEQSAFESFLERYQLKDKKIILTVGNLVERKGQDMVIKSLPGVLKEVPQALYLIIGSGPYKNTLKQNIKTLNLEKYVRFFEQISDQALPLFYQACHVFIMPSRELKNKQGKTIDVEGFGMVFLEANLFAKPVIGGNSGGVPEAIAPGFSGLLVNPENKQEITKAILKLLKDQDYAQKLGEQGRERVFKEFQWPKEVAKIKAIL